MTPPVRRCDVCGKPNPLRAGQRPWDYRMRKSCSAPCRSALQAKARGLAVLSPEQFWNQLLRDGECRVWSGYRNRGGYGRLSYRHEQWSAHRLAFTLANGPIPLGFQVRHSCDNPPCCNPDHLSIGTMEENNRDRVDRGRTHLSGRSGEANSSARLTPDQVREIRQVYSEGRTSQAALAKIFGVSKQHVARIVNGQRWSSA